MKKSARSRLALILLLEVIFGVILCIGSLFLFLKIRTEVAEQGLAIIDTQIIHFLFQLRTPLLTQIMIYVSYLGWELLVAGGIFVIILLIYKEHKREAFTFAFIIAMAVIINNILKAMIQRQRPELNQLISITDYSFPSGHAMISFVFYATLSYLVFHFTKNKGLALAALTISFLIIILIGVSRVYLGVHYPSDVLAGYFGGLAWFGSVFLIQKTLVFFEFFKENRRKRK